MSPSARVHDLSLWLGVFLFTCALSVGRPATASSFELLDSLVGVPGYRAYPVDANYFGTVLGGVSIDQDGIAFSQPHATRWADGAPPIDLGWLPNGNPNSSAQAMSADGTTVAGTSSGAAFVWTAAIGMVPITSASSEQFDSVRGVSADGSVVLVRDPTQGMFLWRSHFDVEPAIPPGATTLDFSVGAFSDDTQVVVGATASPNEMAFRWSEPTGFETLVPPLPFDLDDDSEAVAVSGDGTTVVGNLYAFSGDRVFRWQGSVVEVLDPLPGATRCDAIDVSADGTRIVGTCRDGTLGSIPVHFFWDESAGTRSLEDLLADEGIESDLYLDVVGISGDGTRIFGLGFDTTNGPAGFRITLPESGFGLSIALAGLFLASRSRGATRPAPSRSGR